MAQERILFLPSTLSEQAVAETHGVVQMMSGVTEAFVDAEKKTITVRGTAEQLQMAEWIARTLETGGEKPVMLDGGEAGVTCAIFAKRSDTPAYELATVIRSVTSINKIAMRSDPRVVLVRGNQAQVTVAAWLVEQLNRDSVSATQPPELKLGDDDLLRVYGVPRAREAAELQETAAAIRSAARISQMFTYSKPMALVVRGTAAQMDIVQKMVQ